MPTPSARRRAFLLFVCLPLATLVLSTGPGCPSAGPTGHHAPAVVPEDPGTIVVQAGSFGIDLVNGTEFDVDPGVSVDQFGLDLGTLAPLEGLDLPTSFDVDCFPGDTLIIDPTLFLSDSNPVAAANAPVVLYEGTQYLCGNLIELDFTQDTTGQFFVDVFVNGVLANP